MQLDLTPEQADAIRRAIESGRVGSAEDALREAVDFWIDSEVMDDKFHEIFRALGRMREQERFARLRELFAQAFEIYKAELIDDPFRTFDEWDGEADRRAYADF